MAGPRSQGQGTLRGGQRTDNVAPLFSGSKGGDAIFLSVPVERGVRSVHLKQGDTPTCFYRPTLTREYISEPAAITELLHFSTF